MGGTGQPRRGGAEAVPAQPPPILVRAGSYYLTTTYGALEHIKNYDKITVTRQLSVEVQDSIHRWERRRTLNKARASRSSVQVWLGCRDGVGGTMDRAPPSERQGGGPKPLPVSSSDQTAELGLAGISQSLPALGTCHGLAPLALELGVSGLGSPTSHAV